jgi:hypothetical protein
MLQLKIKIETILGKKFFLTFENPISNIISVIIISTFLIEFKMFFKICFTSI